MNRKDLKELHCITHISNVPSILSHGILSHKKAEKISHCSISKDAVQEIRSKVKVPGGRPLHEYANLYICARNPMLFLRKDQHEELCVLKVDTSVIDLPGVVITDQNAAATKYVLFKNAPDGLESVDKDLVFAERWTHPENVALEFRHKSVKCAEVLVPDKVETKYIRGAYVSCESSEKSLQDAAKDLKVTINPGLFFI